MTPAKRRPAKRAATKDSTQEAPTGDAGKDSAPPTETGQVDREDRAATKDSTQEAPTGDAGKDSAPPTETGQVDREDRAATQSPGRSRALHPERVWPD
jgi:hypothetical protein